ncbi:hypothetical protein AMATHDRAFT_57984 [Amanita thiersii Skay4041]|uniref:Uncharacterized protein n=1 Tax=Amanita thiersii Skay4041 TaxID=703135 RepID=A0A2A9NM83_9AGAR|nr:hypothetical protein AMATHDRAFT_57984 [Amanita thiersii Skay4041]
MSVPAGTQEVLKPMRLLSTTPPPNEKVLRYLETMSREGQQPDCSPPKSIIDADDYRNLVGSPKSGRRSQLTTSTRSRNGDDRRLNMSGAMMQHPEDEEADDADSNVQQGLRSEAGEPAHEPGPTDPPGPKYESYDSGPSFGNFGALPPDDYFPPTMKSDPRSLRVDTNPPWHPDIDNNSVTLTQGGIAGYAPSGVTSGYPAKIPLPASEFITSPRPPTVNIEIEAKSPSQRSRAMSRGLKANPNEVSAPMSPLLTQSRAATHKPEHEKRPMSPASVKSKLTTQGPGTERGTVYPPLPESRFDDGESGYDIPLSPKARSYARSKAPSVSPSDSLSQIKPYGTKVLNGSSLSQSGHQSRAFSPYRHAATMEDLIHAAARGRALPILEVDEHQLSEAPSVHQSKPPSLMPSHASQHSYGNKAVSLVSAGKPPSVAASKQSRGSKIDRDSNITPTPDRPASPLDLNQEEAKIVQDALASKTPRTSYYASTALEPEVTNHYHDIELCVLLQKENDPTQHDVVKRALRKAIKQRIKRLGMKYDNESINKYRKSYHDHDPSVHLQQDSSSEEPPRWAADIKRELVLMQQRIESLGPKIENLRSPNQSFNNGSRFVNDGDDYSHHTPATQTVNIQTQATGTMAESLYQVLETEHDIHTRENSHFDERTGTPRSFHQLSSDGRDNSTGQQFLREGLYKIHGQDHDNSGNSHEWGMTPVDGYEDHVPEPSHLSTIPDTNGNNYDVDRSDSPPLPAVQNEEDQQMVPNTQKWHHEAVDDESHRTPWQHIQARLFNWGLIWPLSELDHALNSTTRGHQVDEVALSIWSTQTYKRYVRARLTDNPPGVVDRLYVPPNMAEAINNAVFNGRHGEACGMLRDMWSPFGLEGIPRLLVVLAKHRGDDNHWVVHRFSLPEGLLSTYDSYPERTLPDGRPLGWWFAIRLAWPEAQYPSPERLMQKTIRLHRPMQLPIDNSVSAAGVWRNILMGSRPERSLDLERLRDLINTEVKNLRQRKQIGKLFPSPPRQAWEEVP